MNQDFSGLQQPDPELAGISNFRQYSDVFASAGQPTGAQLSLIAGHDFERIVYIAFSTHKNAVADEDKQVKALGMEYLHIPVDFDRPLPAEFYAFADYMQRAPQKKTLLHCQVNFRATAFAFLYRVIFLKVPMQQAKDDMNTVWQPDDVWRDFIFTVLAENDLNAEAQDIDWASPAQ